MQAPSKDTTKTPAAPGTITVVSNRVVPSVPWAAVAELRTEPYRLRRQVGEIDTTELCSFQSDDEMDKHILRDELDRIPSQPIDISDGIPASVKI